MPPYNRLSEIYLCFTDFVLKYLPGKASEKIRCFPQHEKSGKGETAMLRGRSSGSYARCLQEERLFSWQSHEQTFQGLPTAGSSGRCSRRDSLVGFSPWTTKSDQVHGRAKDAFPSMNVVKMAVCSSTGTEGFSPGEELAGQAGGPGVGLRLAWDGCRGCS